MTTTDQARANKTDAGNGSNGICRVSNVLRSPSPDPRRSAQKLFPIMSIPKRRIFGAWIVGGLYYMILAMEVVADAGVIAFPFQAVMGAFFSIVVVGLAFLVGQVLRIRSLNRVWYGSSMIALAVVLISFGIALFGREVGLTAMLQLSEDQSPYQTLHPAAAYGGMVAAVFGMLHFPRKSKNQAEHLLSPD